MPLSPDDITLQFRPQRAAAVAAVELDGETVIYDERTGDLHVLNQTATLLWRCLDGSTDLAEIVDDFAHAFDIPAHVMSADVLPIVRQLGAQGLLEGVDASPATAHAPSTAEGEPA